MTRPVKRWRAEYLEVTVWENEPERVGAFRSRYWISLQRRYRTSAGEWKAATSLRPRDLLVAKVLLEEAYRFVAVRSAPDAG